MDAQAHIFYSGRVQGVGFRYTVERLASGTDLKGWVKNLPDGRVEVVVRGPRETIDDLCGRIEGHFKNYIRDKEIDFEPASEVFRDFSIRF